MLTGGTKIASFQACVQTQKLWGAQWPSDPLSDHQDGLGQPASTVPAAAAAWLLAHPEHLCADNVPAGPTLQRAKSA